MTNARLEADPGAACAERAITAPGSWSSLNDEALLKLCAQQNADAVRELVRRYEAPIYRFLARMMGSEQDAEEAAMEVFVRAWQHASRFQYRAKVSTWLYRIATNIARDAHEWRMLRPREVPLDNRTVRCLMVGSAEEVVLEAVDREDRSRLLQQALARLSETDRLILILYYLEEKEYRQIQAITGLSYAVLKTRLARARRRLRAHVEKIPSREHKRLV